MTHAHLSLSGKRLTTPRAAAIAGILFAILFAASVALIRISLPPGPVDGTLWQENQANLLRVGLILMPFVGISFLWFVGVVRDRLGVYEDQFFSTIFYGSALLFLAMVFSATAVTGGIATAYAANPDLLNTSEIYSFSRGIGRTVLLDLRHAHGRRIYDLTGHHLAANWSNASLVVTYHLSVRPNPDSERLA